MSPRLWEWLLSSPPLRAALGSSRPAAVLLQTASSGCAAFPPGTDRRSYGSLELQFPCCKETAVAGDDAGIGVNQNRRIKSKFRDAGGDLSNLGVGVCSGIPGQGNQLVDQPQLDMLNHRI